MVHLVADKNDFDTKLDEAGDKLIVIDFFATWCGPCKIIAPYMEELSTKYENVVFLKVDVDENEEIASEYNVTCMPTFVFVKNKAKVNDFSGANKDKLKELVEKHM